MSTQYQKGLKDGKKMAIKKISIVFQNLIFQILEEEDLIDKWLPKSKRELKVKKK